MVGRDKFNGFEEAFEQGKQGNVRSYNTWLETRGFKPERVNEEFLAQHFWENPEEAANHDEELEEVAQFAGFFSQRTGSRHIPVVGVSGIGKTQFLRTVQQGIEKIGENMNVKRYTAQEFGEVEDEEQRILQIEKEVADSDSAVILVDDCGEDKRINDSLSRLSDAAENTLLISAWEPERWGVIRDDIEESIPTTNEVHLSVFNKSTTKASIQGILGIISDGSVTVPDTILDRIQQISSGIPGLFTKLFLSTLKETYLKGEDLWVADMVQMAAEKIKLSDTRERVYDLSSTKLTVLKHMLLSRDSRGVQPSRLVELLNKDKSTISYHLQSLASEGIVTSERSGRSAFYRIREEVKPIVQTRLAKEVKFNA